MPAPARQCPLPLPSRGGPRREVHPLALPVLVLPGLARALLVVPVLVLTLPGLPRLALAQTAGERAVNPLTGMPLSLEQMHWSLEQARLEEQLQASLLNRRKFELERQRLDQAASGVAAPGGLDAGAATALPLATGVAGPGSAAARSAGDLLLPPGAVAPLRPGALAAPAGAPAAPAVRVPSRRRSPAPEATAAAWPVVGVRAQGAQWCLLLAESGQLRPVCSGESHAGHHVEAVSAQGYTVDGVPHVLDIPVARLRAPAVSNVAEGEDGPAAADFPRELNGEALAARPAGSHGGAEEGVRATSAGAGVAAASGVIAAPGGTPQATLLQSAPLPALQR